MTMGCTTFHSDPVVRMPQLEVPQWRNELYATDPDPTRADNPVVDPLPYGGTGGGQPPTTPPAPPATGDGHPPNREGELYLEIQIPVANGGSIEVARDADWGWVLTRHGADARRVVLAQGVDPSDLACMAIKLGNELLLDVDL